MMHVPDKLQFIYQTIGILAVILSFFSFQTRKNKVFLILQSASCALFAIQFSLANAWVAVISNIVCVIRGFVYAANRNKLTNIIFTIVICLAFATISVLGITVFREMWYISILCCSASIASTIAISTNKNVLIHTVQLFYVSPCWLVNNIYYFSIGAIISEILNIISVLITFSKRFIDYQKRKIA